MNEILTPHAVKALLLWYQQNKRDLPWRHTSDPYRIWISEIMLQQTRVAAVLDYYRRFLEAAPTVAELAQLPDDQLMKLWQGLGYYSRARNLQKAARQIMEASDNIWDIVIIDDGAFIIKTTTISLHVIEPNFIRTTVSGFSEN